MLTTASCALSQNRNYSNDNSNNKPISGYSILGIVAAGLSTPIVFGSLIFVGPIAAVVVGTTALGVGCYGIYKGAEEV